MARAVLQIDVDTSGVRRAMGDLRGTARTAQAAMTAEARRAAAQRDRIARDEIRHKQRMDIETVRSQRDADRARTQSAAQSSRERIAASNREARIEVARLQTSAQLFIASERAKTRAVEREEKQRTRAAQTEERTRVAAARAAAREVTRVDRERTRAGRDIGIGLRRGLNVGGDAALNVARVAYSQIRDARRTRAESENTLNGAFYQARLTGPEATAARARLETELATGSLRGMNMEDVAGGISQAQTQFSVLSGATPQARSAALERQIQLLAFARNTYQSPGEVLRVAGMLEQQGVTGADQMNTIRAMTGMAQAGSIELGNVTREALGPLMQNIARVTTSQQSPAERAAAVRGAVSQTMAVGEIGAAAGLTPRDTLNALAKVRTSVTNPMMAERLDTRLRAAGREDLAAQLVTRDAAGRASVTTTDPVQFMSRLVSGMGGDANAVTNLLSAGGARAAMVLDSQQRRLISGMASQTSNGQTIAQRVEGMQAQGTSFSEADVQRGRGLRDAEQLTAINAAETARLNALNDGTSSVVRFARALDDFTARNPILSTAIQTGVGLFGGILGGALFPRIGTALAGTRAGQAVLGLTGQAAALPGQIAGGARVAGRAALGAAGTLYTGLSFGGATSGTDFEENQRRAAATAEWVRSQGGGGAANAAPTAREIGTEVAAALRANPPTATIDPVTAAHAASQNATQPARRP